MFKNIKVSLHEKKIVYFLVHSTVKGQIHLLPKLIHYCLMDDSTHPLILEVRKIIKKGKNLAKNEENSCYTIVTLEGLSPSESCRAGPSLGFEKL